MDSENSLMDYDIGQRVLASEFFEVFGINGEPKDSWIDSKKEITIQEVIEYEGPEKIFTTGYEPKWMSDTDRRKEHIQRIRSILQLSPLLWPPIHLDMDWTTYTPIIEDGHHRAFAAKCLNLRTIPVLWSGVAEVFEENFPKSFEIGLMRS